MAKPASALLALEDGSVFLGKSIGVDGLRSGEVVFNTAMSGYQEILTDPSYAKQLVTLTASHIGNVGTTSADQESRTVFCAALIVKDLPPQPSNWRAQCSLPEYLQANDVVAISDIDTRKLTRLIRTKGAQRGCLIADTNATSIDPERALAAAREFPGLGGMDLAKQVSTAKPYQWSASYDTTSNAAAHPAFAKTPPAEVTPYDSAPPAPQTKSKPASPKSHPTQPYKIIAYDYGVKHNILRLLAQRNCQITVVPAQTSAAEILHHKPDGVFLSNGPGDPEPCAYAIQSIQQLLAHKTPIPIFGICLGHQLLALAAGGETEKMKFGHHGANHPVRDMETGRVFITSQNHGFAVRESSLPKCLRITHRSLFDHSIQGLAHTEKPAFSFQGHPEASPGPRDIGYLFDRFIAMMQASKPKPKSKSKSSKHTKK